MRLSNTQLLILLGLAGVATLVCGAAAAYIYLASRPVVAANPVSSNAGVPPIPPSASAQTAPIPTALPTYAYLPTFTPMPAPTSFTWQPTRPAATQKAAPTHAPAQNPQPAGPSSGSNANCTALLDYAAAMHQYNLDMIDYIHAPMIQFYQSQIWQASVDRDALRLVQLQRNIDAEEAQVKAEKASENKRYKAERASIQASCG